MHILVTGANRGLGLGLVKELLNNPEVKNVFATHRHWSDARELKSIKDPRLHVYQLELFEHMTIGDVYLKIRDTVGEDGLNVIINNAGIFEPYDINGEVNRKLIVDEIEVNAVGPTIICQGFIPQLRKAIKAGKKNVMMVNITDELASMTNCKGTTNRNAIVYQMSKAALNMLTRTMAADSKEYGLIYIAMTPGSIKTDMGGPDAISTVEEAAKDMIDCILHKVTMEHSGGFYDRTLKPLPF